MHACQEKTGTGYPAGDEVIVEWEFNMIRLPPPGALIRGGKLHANTGYPGQGKPLIQGGAEMK